MNKKPNKRLMTAFLNLAILLVLLLPLGCQKSPGKTAAAATEGTGKNSVDKNIETADLNGDQKIDSWLFYGEEKGARRLMQRRLDLNFDGKVDITQYFKSGLVTLEEIDLDFDAQIDARNFYENGIIAKNEMSFDFDGQPRLWRFYKDGIIVRKERDSNRDGKPDAWEYFENGKISRSGKDLNNDGSVDVWE